MKGTPAIPQDLINMAEQLEATARSLRQSAALLQKLAGVTPQSPMGRSNRPAQPIVVNEPPTVMAAVALILRQAAGPVHIREIYERARATGAYVKDQGILSSMLSKDYRANFEPAPGKRGFWQLVQKSSTKGA
jgi:hypothetical protein